MRDWETAVRAAEYIRVLLVGGHTFNHYSGTGVTLTNLFRGWPVERISIAHNDRIPHESQVCRRVYELGREELRWTWPRSVIHRWRVKRSRGFWKSVAGGRGGKSSSARNVLVMRKYGKDFVWFCIERLGATGILERPHVTSRLMQWITEFQPDIVYSSLGNLTYVRLTWQLASVLRVPIAVHMMDDWPAVIYRGGAFGPYFRRRLQVELKHLIEHAAVRMGISDKMCREYESRYGQPFLAFQNVVDLPTWLTGGRRDWKPGTPFRVVYAGSIIHNSNLESLGDICDAVAGLYASGMNIEMELHCPAFYAERYRSQLQREPGVRIKEPPEENGVASLFASADLLVLPVNFDEESVRYIRYSMPTKIPAYMISGTPVLVYGPRDVASVQYAHEGKWGYVVSSRDVPGVREAIRSLASDTQLRASLGRRAQELAVQNHDAAKIRPAFRQALARAAACRVP